MDSKRNEKKKSSGGERRGTKGVTSPDKSVSRRRRRTTPLSSSCSQHRDVSTTRSFITRRPVLALSPRQVLSTLLELCYLLNTLVLPCLSFVGKLLMTTCKVATSLVYYLNYLTMCLIETYLQMANIDREVKRTAELPSNTTTRTISTSSLATTADSFDTNNNEQSISPVVIIEEVYEQEQETKMEKANEEVVKDVNPTPPTTPSPAPSSNDQRPQQQNGNNLQENFKLFAKFGDSKSSGEAITLSNSDKWFKQAKIIDGKKVTTVDTGKTQTSR